MANSHYSGDSPPMSPSHPGFAVGPDLIEGQLFMNRGSMSDKFISRVVMLGHRYVAAGATFSSTLTIA
jgi:hypothetical protein